MPKSEDELVADMAEKIKAMSVDDQSKLIHLASSYFGAWPGDHTTNRTPAFEEGPHLKDPKIRAAKKQAMLDAGMTADDENLTEDMRAILREKE